MQNRATGESGETIRISKKTNVSMPLSLLGSVLIAAIAGASAYADLRGRLIRIEKDMWTAADMEHWAQQLSRMNPSLNVPDVYDARDRRRAEARKAVAAQ